MPQIQTQTIYSFPLHLSPNFPTIPLPSPITDCHQRKNSPITAMASAAAIAGLGAATSLRSKSHLSSSFLKPQLATRSPRKAKVTASSTGRITCFERDWLRKDLNVIGFGIIGWLAPSSVPAINGDSLSGLFFSSMTKELAHFPTGPALSSDFWLWMVLWHLGLFICLTFGQIGFKGRQEKYF